jgi:hypothetical protein
MEPLQIALVRYPSESERLERLRAEGQARLLLVEGDASPPITVDLCEDWVRVPADERDVLARSDGIRRRLGNTDEPPKLDEDGLLRFGGRWVSIPPMEVRLLSALIDRMGSVVSRDELSERTWPEGAKGRNALDVHMLRLRRRVAPVGLAIRTVRSRGYLIEPSRAVLSDESSAAS